MKRFNETVYLSNKTNIKLIDKPFNNFILTILAYFDMSTVYWFNEIDIVSKAIDNTCHYWPGDRGISGLNKTSQ